MYKLIIQQQLENEEYRNLISYPFTYDRFDVRTKTLFTLEELLNKVDVKYGKELCELNSEYIIRLDEE